MCFLFLSVCSQSADTTCVTHHLLFCTLQWRTHISSVQTQFMANTSWSFAHQITLHFIGAAALKIRAGALCSSVVLCLLLLTVRGNDEVSSCLRAWSVIVVVSPAWLWSEEPRTEPSGLAPDDPAIKDRDISISVGDATCQQKVNGKMKEIQKEILSDSFTFIRVTEGEKTAMRGVLLWGFLSNFNLLLVTLYLSLSSQLSLSFCLLVPPVCLCLCLSVCLHGCQLAALTTHHLSLNLQPCHRLLSPPTMWTSTLRRQPTTRSTAASRGPRSSWRSGTATAWRGWVIGPSWGPRPPNEGGNMSNLCC